MDASGLRLFYALWPDAAVRARLAALQTGLTGRLVRPANLHLTLAFLGNQPRERLPELEALLAALPPHSPLLSVDRLGYFARPGIAWAGVTHMPAQLPALQGRLAEALRQAGVQFDEGKSFKPHVTLARDAQAPVESGFEPIAWHAREVALVHSVNERSGVAYRVLAARMLPQ